MHMCMLTVYVYDNSVSSFQRLTSDWSITGEEAVFPGTVMAIIIPLEWKLLLDTALNWTPVIHLLPSHFPELYRLVSAGNFSTMSSETGTSEMKICVLPYTIAFYLHALQDYKCCATNRKVAGSIPVGVGEFFIDIKSFRSHYGPGVVSASNINE